VSRPPTPIFSPPSPAHSNLWCRCLFVRPRRVGNSFLVGRDPHPSTHAHAHIHRASPPPRPLQYERWLLSRVVVCQFSDGPEQKRTLLCGGNTSAHPHMPLSSERLPCLSHSRAVMAKLNSLPPLVQVVSLTSSQRPLSCSSHLCKAATSSKSERAHAQTPSLLAVVTRNHALTRSSTQTTFHRP
jgi:hypothetical protein